MTLRDILVHVDDRTSCQARVEAAAALAADHEAHLIGLYVISSFAIPPQLAAEMSGEVLEIHRANLQAAADRAKEVFEAATKASGVATEWRCMDGVPMEILTDQARYADLVIVGQHGSADSLAPMVQDIPDNLALTAGRPVLVIPDNYAGKEIGKRVMIGWDSGQTASRALHDALPILEKADHVAVMVVNPKDRGNGNTALPGADVARHLARHDIRAEADHVTSKDMGVGDQLLSRAADLQADLLVTGAYGHARWREIILGGVTRQLLDSMPVPVLMSH